MGESPFGFEMSLEYLSTGTRAGWDATSNIEVEGAAPENLTEITTVRDVTLNLEHIEDDDTDRAGVWVITDQGLKDCSIDFTIRNDNTDLGWLAVRDAWLNKTAIAIACLDGPSGTAGSQGVWADWKVSKFARGEPLKGKSTIDVSIKPGRATVPPQWVTVTT